ncbi:MAG: HD domain-containing protein [Anaerolineaceae bacterium]|nr:HD domain-containing protein [Anaerolineaceae bacterium]
MNIPTLAQAGELIAQAMTRNPGPWERHSWFVGRAAQAIATRVPGLDPDAAFILGYLHDLGRGQGVTDMRHVLDGYTLLAEGGYSNAARISLTHSFPIQKLEAVAGKWDCSPQELEFIRAALADCEYDLYDRLIQLCDSIALPSGFCLIEKRLMDVALRHGVNEYSVPRWKAYLSIQREFEDQIGQSIYRVLPGVVENTFGFNPCADFEG